MASSPDISTCLLDASGKMASASTALCSRLFPCSALLRPSTGRRLFGWPKRSRGFGRISDRRNLLALRGVADSTTQLVLRQASIPAVEALSAPRKHDVSVILDRLQPSSTGSCWSCALRLARLSRWGAIRLYEGIDPSPCSSQTRLPASICGIWALHVRSVHTWSEADVQQPRNFIHSLACEDPTAGMVPILAAIRAWTAKHQTCFVEPMPIAICLALRHAMEMISV